MIAFAAVLLSTFLAAAAALSILTFKKGSEQMKSKLITYFKCVFHAFKVVLCLEAITIAIVIPLMLAAGDSIYWAFLWLITIPLSLALFWVVLL